jgi:DNA-binding beta-propeller fold protein YncE
MKLKAILITTVVAIALGPLEAAAPAQAAPFVYVTNSASSSNNVSQYTVGPGGLLAPLSPPTVAAGAFPVGVAVSPGAESVYVANELGNDISQYDIGSGGTLSPKSPPVVAAGSFPFGVGGSPSRLAVSPGGGSVYVANHDSNNVSQYDVGAGGALTPKSPATVPAGTGPVGVAVSPDGRSVYVTNDFSGNVSQYDIGAAGELSPKTPPTVPAGGFPAEVAVSSAPRVPTSKAQCKNGGWRNFPQFKNQGQCIAFVNHGP